MSETVNNIHPASLLRNSSYRMTGFVLSLLFMLLLTPYFVKVLGPEKYGLWAISISMLGFAGMLDWGIGTAVTKYISQYLSLGDSQRLAECVLASTVIYFFLGIFGTVFLWAFTPQIISWFKMSPGLVSVGIEVLHITALGILPMFLRNCFLAVPMGFQKYGFSTAISLTKEVAGMGGMALILLMGGQLTGVVSWMVFVSAGTAFFAAIMALFLIKSVNAFRFSFKKDAFTEILKFAVFAGTSGVGSRVFNMIDRILVGILLNTSMVTYYVVPVSMANKLRGFIANISHVFMPRISSLQAKSDYEKIRSLFSKSHKLTAYMVFGSTSLLFIISKPLLSFWVGPDFVEHSLGVLRILLVAYAFISLAAPSFYFANGLGMPWINAFCSLFGGALSIGFMCFAGKQGLSLFAWANCGFALVLLIPIVTMKKIGLGILDKSKDIFLKPIGACTVLITGFLFFEERTGPWLWGALAVIVYGLMLSYEYYPFIKRLLTMIRGKYIKDLPGLQGQTEKP
ncbi:MAG: MATE family efflux transporter [bacterium]